MCRCGTCCCFRCNYAVLGCVLAAIVAIFASSISWEDPPTTSNTPCDYCRNASAIPHVFTERGLSEQAWSQACAHSGHPCLITLTDPSKFRLSWEDVVKAAQNLSPSPFDFDSWTTSISSVPHALLKQAAHLAYCMVSNDATNCEPRPIITLEQIRKRTQMGDSSVRGLRKKANTDPAGFFRNWSLKGTRVSRNTEQDVDWYAFWYDGTPTGSFVRKQIPDHELTFMPSNVWARGSGFWLFVGWLSSSKRLPGKSFHVDHISESPGTFHIQMMGRKLWRVKPAEECADVCGTRAVKIAVSPGQLLFINTQKWQHETELVRSESPGGLPLNLDIAIDLHFAGQGPL